MQKLAIDYLRETKDRLPDKPSIVDRNGSVTFSELWRLGVALGEAIRHATGAWNVPFVVDIDQSVDAVVAFVAVQLSGNIYVPFDVKTPRERRHRALESLGPHHVLDSSGAGFRLDGNPLAPSRRPFVDAEAALLLALAARNGLDPLYVIFTSGSTGVPKGVTIANASVIDYIDWARRIYGVTEREVIGGQAPFYFDNSVLDLYLTFACGATLHLIDRERFVFLPSLIDYLRDRRITFVFFVPSVLSNIAALNLLDDDPLPELRKVLFAGEAMPPSTLQHLRAKLPNALLSNLYGPTEITVDCIYWIFGDVIDEQAPVPLGIPCENSAILFLSDEGRIVAEPDTVAEICVGGIGVALGYWNDPEKTRSVFVQNPEHDRYRQILYRTGDLGYRSSKDGLIYMVGRKDDQFKHLGHRIEPGEIASALNRIPGVVQSFVQYDEGKKAIVAFYCAAGGGEIRGLREALSDALPPYMIPREFLLVDGIPITPAGKVDRDALWEMRRRRRSGRAAQRSGPGDQS